MNDKAEVKPDAPEGRLEALVGADETTELGSLVKWDCVDESTIIISAPKRDFGSRRRKHRQLGWFVKVDEALWAVSDTFWDQYILKPLLFVFSPYSPVPWEINGALVGMRQTISAFPRFLVLYKNPLRAAVESCKYARDRCGYFWLKNILPDHMWMPSGAVSPNEQVQPRAERSEAK